MEILPWLVLRFAIPLVNVGDDAAFRVDALARIAETSEAGFLVVLIMTKAVGARGILLDG